MAVSVPLPHDLGHDDRLLLPEFCDFFITWFPTYLVQARGFSLKELGTLGILPALVSIPRGWFGGNRGVMFRIAIEPDPKRCPYKPQQARYDKGLSPAESADDPGDQGDRKS